MLEILKSQWTTSDHLDAKMSLQRLDFTPSEKEN